MIKLGFWDKQSPLTLPNGVEYTPEEIMRDYPISKAGKTVLEYLGNGWVGAIDNLDILRQVYGITTADDDAALAEIIAIRNAPPPEPTVSEADELIDILLGVE